MERFVGKIAVVTGASRGIGKAITKKLLEKGVNVVGLARNLPALQAMAEEVSNDRSTYSGTFYALQCDVAKETEVQRTFRKIEDIGPVWILVNNAGGNTQLMLDEVTNEIYDEIFGPYTKGVLFCSNEALKSMTAHSVEGGHILTIVEIPGPETCIDYPDDRLIMIAKTAERAFSEGVRWMVHKKKLNVKISNINPGLVNTEAAAPYLINLNSMQIIDPEDIANGCVAVLNTPTDITISDITIRPTHYTVTK